MSKDCSTCKHAIKSTGMLSYKCGKHPPYKGGSYCSWNAGNPTDWESVAGADSTALPFKAGDIILFTSPYDGCKVLIEVCEASPAALKGTIVSATKDRYTPGQQWNVSDPQYDRYTLVSNGKPIAKINTCEPTCKCRGGGFYGHDHGCPMDGYHSKKSTAYFK